MERLNPGNNHEVSFLPASVTKVSTNRTNCGATITHWWAKTGGLGPEITLAQYSFGQFCTFVDQLPVKIICLLQTWYLTSLPDTLAIFIMKKINLRNRLPVIAGIILIALPALQAQRQTSEPGFLKVEWSNTVGTRRFNPVYFLQDSRGMMWMATSLGVVSFDGYHFKLYSPEEYHLSSSKIVRLAEDMNGNIWIMGFRNSRIVMDVMNPKTETVQPLHRFLGQEQPVEIPMRDEYIYLYNIEGKIWAGTIDAGYLYDGTWQQVYQPGLGRRVRGGWCPAKSGFWSISALNKRIYLENSSGERIDSISDVHYFWLDNTLNLWTNQAGGKQGYRQLTAEGGKLFIRDTDVLPSFGWIGENIYPQSTSSPYRSGFSWRLQQSDLYLTQTNGGGTAILNREFPEISPTGNFFFDRENGIWTATSSKIIHLQVNETAGFKTFLTDNSHDRSIRGMLLIGNKLYVNSPKGDCILNLDNFSVTGSNICNNQGLAVMSDGNGFWAGGHGGIIARIEPGKDRVIYPLDRLSDVTSFLRCSTGILAGTSNGLYKISTADRKVEPTRFLSTGIYYLYQNARGIWACTTNGLFLIDEQGNTLAHFLGPQSGIYFDRINHLYEDENGDFWLATNGAGIIHWSEKKGVIRHFTESDGLSNSDIHAVYDDRMGYLWLPSNYGLMRLHKESGRIQAFFKRNGIADSEFNSQSHYQAADGRLFFGGVNGVTAFYPKDIPLTEDKTPVLRLVEARTFQIKSGSYQNHLREFDTGSPVPVTPDDDYLDIRVSPLVYDDVNQIRYSWRIEGYSDNWVQQQSPLIRLHNLPYGEHKLRVRYSLQGNIWSENEIIIPVRVTRPFYLTWPFLALVLLMILLTTWIIGNRRAIQLKKANQRLEEEVRHRTRKIESDKQLIEHQARELRSLDEMKSRFFTNITHELRTPLTLILGPVQSILKSDQISKSDHALAEMIQRNAVRLLTLVEELLDLSKVDAGKLVVAEKPVRLYQFIARLVAAFEPYADHRGVELNLIYDCPPTTTLMMDIPKWEKIINNLLNNALKFTPNGGTIIVSVENSRDELTISVEDTGIGISADDLPFIFDRYYQARGEGAAMLGGTGIGLSLCREYIKLFGGEIIVQSEPGRGSKFILRRPLAITAAIETDSISDSAETIQMPKSNLTPAPNNYLPEKRTLLIVEDDRDMSSYIQRVLRDDYNLLVAENGKEALDIIENSMPDIVLSDVMMPEMDGFQLLQAVRERYLDIPFIMLTARADAPDRLAALTLGVDDYLTKPFIEAELTVRLQNLITRYDIRKAAQSKENSTGETDSFDQKWLKQLELLVVENMSNPDLAVSDLAVKMNISRRNLYNKVLACTGISPSQYITEIRLNRARYLIETKAFETVSEVCYAVGFKTPHYFSKLMKERFG